ncbi:hypothetical protein [Streptomyces sp. NPDC059788]|uniref:hypothetical protein n=1 Tax=Streptomyces sp. NPDC059788 TaxID=3346948 RepID=UPI00364FA7AA
MELAEEAGISVGTAKDVRDRVRSGRDPLPPRLRAAENRRERTKAEKGDVPSVPASPLPIPAPLSQDVAADIESVVNALLRDPSMRTDAGRALLYLLRMHAVQDGDKWRQLAAGVPGHRAETVARAARRCAEQWARFAKEVEGGRRRRR